MERLGLLPICVLSSATGDEKHSNSHPPGHSGVNNTGGVLQQCVEPGIQVRQWFAMLNSHVKSWWMYSESTGTLGPPQPA